MVQFVASKPVNMNALEVFDVMSNLGTAVFSDLDSDSFVVTFGSAELLVEGSGFDNVGGKPTMGAVDKITVTLGGSTAYSLSNLGLDVPHFLAADGVDPANLAASIFDLTDNIGGSNKRDVLLGFGENDALFGGGGRDKLKGGDENDYLNGGAGKDVIDGGAGTNLAGYEDKLKPVEITLKLGEVVKAKVGGQVEDKLKNISNINGGNGDDRLTGDAAHNNFGGGAGKDVLKGRGGFDELFAGSGNDILKGGAGGDQLYGDLGSDTLTGGSGDDFFGFFNYGANNVDTIKDFVIGEDVIFLSDTAFPPLPLGDLDPGRFALDAPGDADDYIVYSQSEGEIYFDLDGNGPEPMILFARVTKGLALSAADFTVFDAFP